MYLDKTTINIDTFGSKAIRDYIDRKLTYITSQFGARLIRKDIYNPDAIRYEVEVDDYDTYVRYGSALSKDLANILCDYTIETAINQPVYAIKKEARIFSNVDTVKDDDDNNDPDYVYTSSSDTSEDEASLDDIDTSDDDASDNDYDASDDNDVHCWM